MGVPKGSRTQRHFEFPTNSKAVYMHFREVFSHTHTDTELFGPQTPIFKEQSLRVATQKRFSQFFSILFVILKSTILFYFFTFFFNTRFSTVYTTLLL